MVDDFLKVRVYYEDTDAAGVVYHANYLKYMERARTEWLNAMNLPLGMLEKNYGILFTACQAHIDFRKPARLNDLLKVATVLHKCRRVSMTFVQEIYHDGVCICQAEIKIACINKDDFRPTAIPKPLLNKFKLMTEGLTK